ncbi:hypothetical protein PRIPAC_88953 [Pristionchus pacificus]|uniref:Uncharacterized protein n=1 Tax=Pristionchus pacificus TaxID=54126 RepID=A0A2A6CVF3_PRIPA|nr:hypothetical protein PRIPAC_88953 [Pristionchus pacificus]|eukprot:PDM82001.1 hypothetical protein PRIPAC_36394 [Pristionchus pacificus]
MSCGPDGDSREDVPVEVVETSRATLEGVQLAVLRGMVGLRRCGRAAAAAPRPDARPRARDQALSAANYTCISFNITE